jgi:hypothetical protein
LINFFVFDFNQLVFALDAFSGFHGHIVSVLHGRYHGGECWGSADAHFFVLCTLCCQVHWVVHYWLCCVFVFLCLVYPMLSGSLGCPLLIELCICFSSSCVPYVVRFIGLAIINCVVYLFFFVLCTLCRQVHWVVHY